MGKSRSRDRKTELLLMEGTPIEIHQREYTGRTLRTKGVKDMSCLPGFFQYIQPES